MQFILSASFTFTVIQNNNAMMKKVFSAAGILLMFALSCKNGDSSVEKISFDSSIVTKSSPASTVDTSALVQNNNAEALPQQPLPAAANQTTPVNPNQPVTTAAGMNPAHGQPGHRCDIPVGAPLNSPPGKTTAATTNAATTQPVTMNTTTTPVKTAPGMNPPHGQPGHRCDIAVGAPLNSAPTKQIISKTDANTISPSTETLPKTTSPAAQADSSKH